MLHVFQGMKIGVDQQDLVRIRFSTFCFAGLVDWSSKAHPIEICSTKRQSPAQACIDLSLGHAGSAWLVTFSEGHDQERFQVITDGMGGTSPVAVIDEVGKVPEAQDTGHMSTDQRMFYQIQQLRVKYSCMSRRRYL